jgi:hypothetical protein
MKMLHILALFIALLGFTGPSIVHAASGTTSSMDEAAQIELYLSKSQFNKYQRLVLGDPLASLKSYADLPRKANLPRYIAGMAGLLILVGFALSLWRAAIAASETALKGAFINMIVSSAMLAACFNYANGEKTPWSFSAMMFQQWGSSYDWSRRTFAADMDQHIEEARVGMNSLISQVVAGASLFAIPGGAGLAMNSVRGFAQAAKGERLLAGTKTLAGGVASHGKKAAPAVLGKLNMAMTMMQFILMAYSFVITITGLLVLACIYVLPFGFAAINFGSTRILWSVFGTFFACWFTVLLTPLFLAVSLNKTFVEPVKAMEYYTQNLRVERQHAHDEAQLASQKVQEEALASINNCQSAPGSSDGALQSEPCAELRGSGWMEKMMDGLTDVLTQRLGVISDLFNGVVNSIATAFWGFIIAAAGMLMSIGIMVATPARFAGLLGGVAEQMRGKG